MDKLKKKGVAGTGILFFVFFFLMIVIGGGIVGGMYAFFGQGYESRQLEANVLYRDVKECFLDEGNDFFNSNFDFYLTCRFNENIVHDYLILISRFDNREEVFWGNKELRTQCGLKDASFPRCKNGLVLKNNIKYEILVANNQKSRKIQ